jgi:hypothetical protein
VWADIKIKSKLKNNGEYKGARLISKMHCDEAKIRKL